MTTHVRPAYGRDYKSMAQASADWDAGKDFVVCSFDASDGRLVNKEQLSGAVNIRYAKLTKVVVVQGGRDGGR